MCSVNLNRTANNQLTSADNQAEAIEKKVKRLAFAANRETPGQLDALGTHRKRMPDALKDIRKHDVGYHRIYYTGHNTDCCYNVFYLLVNKRGDNRNTQDDNRDFQRALIEALADKSSGRLIEDPEEKKRRTLEEGETQSKREDWKDKPWYREYYESSGDQPSSFVLEEGEDEKFS